MTIEEKIFQKNRDKIIKALKNAEKCSYYKKIFKDNCIEISTINTYEKFKAIPIMTKQDYRENFMGCVREGILSEQIKCQLKEPVSSYSIKDSIINPLDLEIYLTSGSTGIPLEIIRHKSDMKMNYISINNYRKIIGKVQTLTNYVWVLPESIASRKYVYNTRKKFFRDTRYGYIACLDKLTKEKMQEFIEFCCENKIKAIIGWPTFFERLVEFLDETNQKEMLKSVEYLESNSELLTEIQYDKIVKFFGIPITNIYSGNETNFIGVTCKNNFMHVLDDNVFVELIKNEFGISETIITNLNSNYTSLIRYNLGDVAAWDERTCKCECNTKYTYKIRLLNYRSNDMVVAKGGVKYEFNIIADPLNFSQIKYGINIGKYKVIQNKEDVFTLYYCYDTTNENINKIVLYLKKYLREVLGYEVAIITVQKEINWDEFSYNRKYRYFECQV